MPKKVMFGVAGGVDGLVALHTSDVDNNLAAINEDEFGRVYRFVKNSSSTALVQNGCCLRKLGQTYPADAYKYVLSHDAATGPATCLITVPAGVPVTGIGASGSSTGDYGWIQVAGTRRVSMWQTATAAQQQAGCVAIGTTISTGYWDKPVTGTIDSTNGGTVFYAGVRLAASLATTGVATAASALVEVRCLA